MSSESPTAAKVSLKWVALVAAAIASATATGLRPEFAESWKMWAALLVPYSLLSIAALRWLKQQGTLGQTFRLKSGDVSIGILAGIILVAGAFGLLSTMLPKGSMSAAWLFQIYLQVGDVQAFGPPLLALLTLVVMEELVWRGMVQQLLTRRLGERRAVPLTALTYALAHLPTVFTLQVSGLGTNPLLLVAAAIAGLCFGFMAQRLGRLVPVILAHAVFSYFLAGPMPRLV